MSESAQTAPATNRTRKRRVLAAVVVVVLVAVALLTGIPQRITLEYVVHRALGANVRVRGLSLVPRLRIAELRVADVRDADAAPVVLADVDLAYALNAEQGVTINAVDIGTVNLQLHKAVDGTTNYAFVERLLQPQPGQERDTGDTFEVSRYLPESFTVGEISIEFEVPEGSLALSGLRFDAAIESLLGLTARLQGDNVRGSLRMAEDGETRPVTGKVDIQVLRDMASTGVMVTAALNELATLDAKAHLITAPGATAAQIEIDEARLLDDGWTVLLQDRFRFETLDFSGTKLTLSSPPGVPWDVSADIQLQGQGIRYGEAGHEWYQGDLAVSGNYDGERGTFETLLNNGQRLSVIAEGDPANIFIAATLIDWNRADLADALPRDWRPLLDNVPHLSQIGASAEFRAQLPQYSLDVSADPIFAGEAGTDEAFSLRINGDGSSAEAARDLFHGDLEVALGAGTIHAGLDFDTADLYTADVSLNTVDLSTVTALLRLGALPEGVQAIVSGTADVAHASKGLSADLDLKLAPATLGAITIPAEQPLTVAGIVGQDEGAEQIQSETLALRFTEDAAIDVNSFSVDFSPFTITGYATGKIDFDYVGPNIGLPSVVGALTVDLPLRFTDGVVESNFRLEGDGFGYRPWSGPYGTPVVLAGLGRYDVSAGTIAIENAEGSWGDETTFTSAQTKIGLSPFSLAGPFTLDTDLSPLVDLRFLSVAEGHGTATGTLNIGTEQTTEVDYEIAATSLTLPDTVAAFGGMASSGSIAYGETLHGRAGFAAADAAAAGAMLSDPRGTATIENGIVRANGVQASLYGGDVTFDVEMNLLDTDAGGRLDARLEGVDLDRFTKEYEPPSVVLTGIANGDVLLVWNNEGLQELQVDLVSEEGFSLNREIIENLLLQSLTADVTGMKKLNRRIQEDTIGEAAQRPFERAAVSLSLQGDTYEKQRLAGPVTLESEMLDLSIDMGVDLPAIASAMELQQQAQLGEGDTISAEPVQWSLPEQSPDPKTNKPDESSSGTAKEEES